MKTESGIASNPAVSQPAARQVHLKKCSVAMMKKGIRKISENGHRDRMRYQEASGDGRIP
jgi:hypothetical protein